MDKSKLTPIQEKILDYIKEETLTKGFPPSVRDICAAVSGEKGIYKARPHQAACYHYL